MRTLRLALVGTVIPALLGGLGGAALAQDEGGFATSGTWVSLVEDQCGLLGQGSQVDQPNGDYQVRGIYVRCRALGTDPRLGESMTYELNEDCFADGGCVNWGPMHVAGPDGTWTGWYTGMEKPVDMDNRFYIVLTGADGYEGLTHIQLWSGPFYGPYDRYGVIFDGQPPPELAGVLTDPVKVVVARQDAVAGYMVAPTVGLVSAAEVGADAFTDLAEVKGRKAAVDIPAGTPITPDLLEPAE